MAFFFLFKFLAKICWFLFDHGFLHHWRAWTIVGIVAAMLAFAFAVLAQPKLLKKSGNPAISKPVLEVVIGGWLGKKMTDAWWAGTTIPFPFFVLMLFWTGPAIPEVDPLVRVHEWVHVQQDVDAKWWFVAWYLYIKEWCVKAWKFTPNKWDLLKPWKWYTVYGNGYWNNKFEQQAYTIEYADRDNHTVPDWA